MSGGAGDGTSWANAYEFLKDAIADAAANASDQNPHEIWVAAGTYYPDRDAADPDGSCNNPEGCDVFGAFFELRDFVSIYGGFTGREAALNDRDPVRNVTILSGDLAGDDDPDDPFNVDLTDDNAEIVVISEGDADEALLDGFHITGGTASGMVIAFDSPTIARCTIIKNRSHSGGGARIKSGNPTFYNCKFIGNRAEEGQAAGGGLYASPTISPASVLLVNCLFEGNEALGASAQGGAMQIVLADADLVNCTIADNSADDEAGGIYFYSGDTGVTLDITNSILWGNTAGSGSTAEQQLTSELGDDSVTYTDLQQDSGAHAGTGNININPSFVNSAGGDYHIASNSPCIDRAYGDDLVIVYVDTLDLNQDDDLAEPTPDLDLDCRVVDHPGATNRGGTGDYPFADMGAYEVQIVSPPACTADIWPIGSGNCLDDGDGGVGPEDLAVLLANWGTPINPCADIAPEGALDGEVDAADLGELLANWGMCDKIKCDLGGSEFAGGGGEGSAPGSGGLGEQDWPEVEMTEQLYDWLTSSTLDDIWDWLWSLLEQ